MQPRPNNGGAVGPTTLTIPEVATRLGVPFAAVQRLVLDHRVPVIELGRCRVIDVEYLEAIGRMLGVDTR